MPKSRSSTPARRGIERVVPAPDTKKGKVQNAAHAAAEHRNSTHGGFALIAFAELYIPGYARAAGKGIGRSLDRGRPCPCPFCVWGFPRKTPPGPSSRADSARP